jgi:outer membrane lipoprotein carrier protein
MIYKRYLVWLALMLIVTPLGAATDASATDSLRHFFTRVQSYSARFSQVVLDESRNVIQESTGRMAIVRPDRFRWDYDTPFKQHIIADGAKIWVYDEELKQVTVRPLAGALADTPAVLLAGRGRIEDAYALKNLDDQGGLQWAQLVPKRKEGGFENIRVGFDQGRMRILEMVDGFGQTTRITLSDPRENPELEAGRFRFTPPAGVDVVGE